MNILRWWTALSILLVAACQTGPDIDEQQMLAEPLETARIFELTPDRLHSRIHDCAAELGYDLLADAPADGVSSWRNEVGAGDRFAATQDSDASPAVLVTTVRIIPVESGGAGAATSRAYIKCCCHNTDGTVLNSSGEEVRRWFEVLTRRLASS